MTTSQLNTPITYIHPENESLSSHIMKFIMRILRLKTLVERDMQSGKINHDPAAIPKSLTTDFAMDVAIINNRNVWTFTPNQNVSATTIVSLHGGAYIYNVGSVHWQFIEQLLRKTNATVVVPDYPLAPTATAQDAYTFMRALYAQLLETTAAENIILMGDSAGAGLALGFAQLLRDDSQPLPQQLILLAPFLDITMSNPDITTADKDCRMLTATGLQLAGDAYAGNLDKKDYRVSPIYGEFADLPPMSVFIGTHDIFIADVRKLKAKLEADNIAFNYFEYPKMIHDWVVLVNLKEAQHAIGQIADLILN